MLLEERSLPLSKEVLSPAVSVSFSSGGRYLAGRTRLDSRIVKVWDTANGAETATLQGHTLPVYCVRFSSDGRILATAACSLQSPDAVHEIKVWDAGTGKLQRTMKGKGRIFNLAFNPAGDLLAWSGQEGLVGVIGMQWSVDNGQWSAKNTDHSSLTTDHCSLATVCGHQGDVSGLAFSGDGRLLASAGMEDRTVKIWSIDHLLAGNPHALHTNAAPRLIGDLAFSRDNRRLAAISRDMVKMWEVDGGHEVLTLRGAPQRYWDPNFNPRLAFSPDGVQLAGTNWDESISTWEALPLDCEEQFARFQEKRRWFADQRTSFWHLQEAELCLQHKNLPAALFHLQRLRSDTLTEPLQSRSQRVKSSVSRSLSRQMRWAL
jgi:WD40 repeat protein